MVRNVVGGILKGACHPKEAYLHEHKDRMES